jgi:hypothetical protein
MLAGARRPLPRPYYECRLIGTRVTADTLRAGERQDEYEEARAVLLRTRRGRLISGLLVAGAIVVAAVVAFGGASQPSPSASSSASQEGCTTGPAKAEVRVTIYGGGEAACDAFDRAAARASEEYWHVMPAAAEEAGRELVRSIAAANQRLPPIPQRPASARGPRSTSNAGVGTRTRKRSSLTSCAARKRAYSS